MTSNNLSIGNSIKQSVITSGTQQSHRFSNITSMSNLNKVELTNENELKTQENDH